MYLFEIMQKYAQGLRGVIHCFSYSKELAREYVKMRFHIGVGGVVTFKNGKKLKEIVEEIPLERILLETDCPYMAPVPYRGKRCDSRMIIETAKAAAAVKELPVETILQQTLENGKRLYELNR